MLHKLVVNNPIEYHSKLLILHPTIVKVQLQYMQIWILIILDKISNSLTISHIEFHTLVVKLIIFNKLVKWLNCSVSPFAILKEVYLIRWTVLMLGG